ncbi:MAG: hypothetical protein AAGG48_17790 [Planctomycetota bacterium]
MTTEQPTPEERIDRYLLGQATAEDIKALNELLATNERARELYRFRVVLESGYREAAIRGDDSESVMDLASAKHVGDRRAHVDSRSMFYGAIVAACLAAIALFVILRIDVDDQGTKAPETTATVSVARLVTSVDAGWQAIDPTPGAMLQAGSFQLKSGIIELQFNRGARVRFRGPASFDLINPDELHVASGSLVARIPEEAIGFTITTDEAEVVDLGTEFGLRVNNGRQTEVHVIEGLVEVFSRRDSNSRSAQSIRVEEGEAIRWTADEIEANAAESIPVQSSRGLLESRQRTDLGLVFLHGNIRLKESVSTTDLTRPASSWIEVIPERSGVILDQDVPVTLVAPGNYRVFGDSGQTLAAGTRIDSYLLHFRSTQPSPVQGVIHFNQPIAGLVCEADQLAVSDNVFGQPGVRYPVASKQYRGLEPRIRFDNPNQDKGGGWTADEVTLSKDMQTLGVSVNVNPLLGVDQLRVLVLSKEQP